jgi:hypothetical protein
MGGANESLRRNLAEIHQGKSEVILVGVDAAREQCIHVANEGEVVP